MSDLFNSHPKRQTNGSAIETYLFKKRNRHHLMDASEITNKSSEVKSSKDNSEQSLEATDILRLHPSMAEKMLLIFANYIREKDRCEENLADKSGENEADNSVISRLLSISSGANDAINESCSLSDEDKIAILARKCRPSTITNMRQTERREIPKHCKIRCTRRLNATPSSVGTVNSRTRNYMTGLSSARNFKDRNSISSRDFALNGNLNPGHGGSPPNLRRNIKSTPTSVCKNMETDLNTQNNDPIINSKFFKHSGKPTQTIVRKNQKRQRLQNLQSTKYDKIRIMKPKKQAQNLIKGDGFQRAHDSNRIEYANYQQNTMQEPPSKCILIRGESNRANVNHFSHFLYEKNENKTLPEKNRINVLFKKPFADGYKSISHHTKSLESRSVTSNSWSSPKCTGYAYSECSKNKTKNTNSTTSTKSAITSNSSNCLLERNKSILSNKDSETHVTSGSYESTENSANIAFSACHKSPSGSHNWPTLGADESDLSKDSSELTRIDDILTSLSENIREMNKNDGDLNSRAYDRLDFKARHAPLTCLYLGEGNDGNVSHRNENDSRHVRSVSDSARYYNERNTSRREITPQHTSVLYNDANRLTYRTKGYMPPSARHKTYKARCYPYSSKHHSTLDHNPALGVHISLKPFDCEYSELSYPSPTSIRERIQTKQSTKYSPVHEEYLSCCSSSSDAEERKVAKLFSSSQSNAYISNKDVNKQIIAQLKMQRPSTAEYSSLERLYSDGNTRGVPLFTLRCALVAFMSYAVPDVKKILFAISISFLLFVMLHLLK